MLDQGEILLPYLPRRVKLPAKHVKRCQSSQHGIELRVVRHLLAKFPGALKYLFHLWGCPAFPHHQGLGEGQMGFLTPTCGRPRGTISIIPACSRQGKPETGSTMRLQRTRVRA